MNAQQISRWMEMAAVKVSKSLTDKNRERVKEHKCLLCERGPTRRGLCDPHYQKFARAKNELPRDERAEWDLKMVQRGVVLGVGQVREILNDNPFKD